MIINFVFHGIRYMYKLDCASENSRYYHLPMTNLPGVESNEINLVSHLLTTRAFQAAQKRIHNPYITSLLDYLRLAAVYRKQVKERIDSSACICDVMPEYLQRHYDHHDATLQDYNWLYIDTGKSTRHDLGIYSTMICIMYMNSIETPASVLEEYSNRRFLTDGLYNLDSVTRRLAHNHCILPNGGVIE